MELRKKAVVQKVELIPLRDAAAPGSIDRQKLFGLYREEEKKGALGGVLPPLFKDEFKNGEYFFIRVNGEVAGAVALLKFPGVKMRFNDKLHVMRILLKSEFRDMNITPKVMEAVENKARNEGHNEIYTRVHPTNTLMLERLKKNGWIEVCEDHITLADLLQHELFDGTKELVMRHLEKGRKPDEIVYKDIVLKKQI